jgi:hypothetical protein
MRGRNFGKHRSSAAATCIRKGLGFSATVEPGPFHVKKRKSSCGSNPGANARQNALEIKWRERALRQHRCYVQLRRANAPFELQNLFERVGHSNEAQVRMQSVSRETIILFYHLENLETALSQKLQLSARSHFVQLSARRHGSFAPPSSLQVRHPTHFGFF